MKPGARVVAGLLIFVLATGCAKLSNSPHQPPPGDKLPQAPLSAPDLTQAKPLVLERSPAPESEGPPPDLARFTFVSQTVGFGVSSAGGIFRTDDAGESWRLLHMEEGARFIHVAFAGERAGFAVGHTDCPDKERCTGPAVIVRTSDGGATWERINPRGLPNSDDTGWWDFGFAAVDNETAYVAGAGPDFLKSTDGGRTWRNIPLPGGLKAMDGLQFITPERGYVSASLGEKNHAVLATTDGGRTWKQIWRGDVPIRSIQFLNDREGFIGGGEVHWRVGPTSSLVLGTADGGATWQELRRVNDYNNAAAVVDLHMRSFNEGCVVQEMYSTVCTEDGGNNWTRVPSYINARLLSVVGDRFWVLNQVGGRSMNMPIIYRSLDRGRTWQTLYQKKAVLPIRVTFVSAKVGWVEAQAGVYRTEDAGAHWTRNGVPPPATGDALYPAGVNLLFAYKGTFAGGQGDLMRSADGGKTWTFTGLQPHPPLHMSFADGQAGWLSWSSMRSGPDSPYPDSLLATTDGGETWTDTKADLPVNSAIALADIRHGAAAGGYPNRTLALTADGGTTWEQTSLPGDSLPTGIDYSNDGSLWLGLSGDRTSHLLHSPDRGRTWTVYTVPGKLWQVTFNSPTDGWLTGDIDGAPLLARTTDGGQTWREVWVEP